MSKRPKNVKHVVLTGAGYTANFGAPVTEKILEKILNHEDMLKNVDLCNKVKKIMLEKNQYNFEVIYQYLNNNDRAKREYLETVIKIYRNFDLLGDFVDNYRLVEDVLTSLEILHWFTLNQDTNFETQIIPRHFYTKKWFYPGVELPNKDDILKMTEISISGKDFDAVYEKQLKEKGNKFFFWKLHGSHHWVNGNDDPILVLSDPDHKEAEVDKFQYTKWQKEKFIKLLNKGEHIKLLIVGYGFGDKYINDLILNACVNDKVDMKIYIISLLRLPEIIKKLGCSKCSMQFIKCVQQIHSKTLSEFCNLKNHITFSKEYKILLDDFKSP